MPYLLYDRNYLLYDKKSFLNLCMTKNREKSMKMAVFWVFLAKIVDFRGPDTIICLPRVNTQKIF